MADIIKQAKEASNASILLASATNAKKNSALKEIANNLLKNKNKILNENKKDIEEAKKNNLPTPLLKRLELDDSKLNELVQGINGLINAKDPVGMILAKTELDKGLVLEKISVPIGVIGVIFESRPDALVQISALCLKSGNAVILKGGSEAKNSNKALFQIIKASSEKFLPKGWIQLIESREEVNSLLKLDKYLSLLIPRGSNAFVKFIQNNTKIPVLGHSEGICHAYVDKDSDIKKAVEIVYDAKTQYPAACNAIETLLVHKKIANKFLNMIFKKFKGAGVEMRGCEATRKIIDAKPATEDDWKTEYNDMVISIKTVNSIDEAISHINTYGSKHSDAIITEDEKAKEKFLKLVDSSSVMVNCSTRFADGFRYGFGAEVGISTNKVHARGPVGLEGLVIYKYLLVGSGHAVSDYSGKNAKKFTHRKLK